jgi:CDGSH-type Zn-finger protein
MGAQMPPTKITVRNDGPLRVEGEVELVDMEGNSYGLGGREAIALCRCGHSASKPFCEPGTFHHRHPSLEANPSNVINF